MINQTEESTQCLIAHLKFISIFDILNWKWLRHIEFPEEVKCLFYQRENYYSKFFPCALVSNNDIYFGIQNIPDKVPEDFEDKISIDQKYTKFVCVGENSTDGDCFFVMYDESTIIAILNKEETEIKTGCEELHIYELQLSDTSMFESDEHPIIIKNGKALDLCTLSTS